MPRVPALPPVYTVSTLADALNIGERTIYNAVRRGELRAAPVNGRGDLAIFDQWVRAWLDARADAHAAKLAETTRTRAKLGRPREH